MMNESATSNMPAVLIQRAPYRSEKKPETGPMITKPRVRGSIYTPAQNGVDS